MRDGLVALQTPDGEVTAQRGEALRLSPGQPPQKTAFVNATDVIQWVLYYPAVLNPDDLALSADEQAALSEVLKNYRDGELSGALPAWPSNQTPAGADTSALRLQLLLAVGRVDEAERILDGSPVVGTTGLSQVEQEERALLNQVSLTANCHHRSGVFGQWESAWFHQVNTGCKIGRAHV